MGKKRIDNQVKNTLNLSLTVAYGLGIQKRFPSSLYTT